MPGRAQDREVVAAGRTRSPRASTRRALAAELDRRVVLARHHVGVRHHDPVAGDPAASLHAQPARGAEHAAPRCGRRARTCGSRAIFEFGGGTFAAGPRIDGNGSKRASAWRIGPDGGSTAFSSLEDLRALDRLAQLARARRLERHRARDPDEEQPEAGHQHAAADPVEQPSSLARAAGAGGSRAPPAPRRTAAPSISAPIRANERRVRRVRAVLEEQRPEPRAEEGADREADQRQRRPRSGPG